MKTLLTTAVLVIVSGSALLAGGCASNGSDRPYGLTGDSQDNRTVTTPGDNTAPRNYTVAHNRDLRRY